MIPGLNGLVPLICRRLTKDATQTVFLGKTKNLSEDVLSGKWNSFVQGVSLFCGKNKLTTFKGALRPLL